MAKHKNKNKKKQVSDKVRAKKRESDKKVNPFEVKINKQKHQVLGKRITKSDKGMPGISRSKAIKKVYYLSYNISHIPRKNKTCASLNTIGAGNFT